MGDNTTEPEGKMEHERTIHSHDHWHVTHYHVGPGPDDFEHRSTYHTHEHDHAGYRFDSDRPDEHRDQHHAAKAHVHDHDNPDDEY